MKKRKNIPIIMAMIMIISIIGTILSACMYIQTTHEFALYISIIFGTVAVHFFIMHISAPFVFLFFRKKFNYSSFWFIPKNFEKNLYKILNVKKWKTKVPAYDSDEYSLETHTVEEVIMNMCHAEVVHEVLSITSYLPIIGGLAISHWGVLVLTSFVFSCCHLIFVIIQRYNRPRIVRLYEMHRLQ
ncbi:MAG: hypothetical protein IJZ94_03520 [Clostridia bacterium]|nr:hypothetical protein [Clostridia bacterium]